jgi:hypothetical protein
LQYTSKYIGEQLIKVRKFCDYKNVLGENEFESVKFDNRGVKFVLFDSGQNDMERFVVFGSESNLIHLKNNKLWIIDGTFKVVPNEFLQLLTIQSRIRNVYVGLIYVLLKRKTKMSYDSFFLWPSEIKKITAPNNIIIDFEQTLYSSLSSFFPNSKLNGCLFHFSQIIWRKLQSFGLTVLFKSNPSFSYNIKLLLAVSFVPEYDLLKMLVDLELYFLRKNADDGIFFSF